MVPADHQSTEPISATITAEIMAARRVQGTTRDEVAAAARLAGAPPTFSAAALRNIETSRRGVTVDELVWLAEALGTPVRGLLAEHAETFGADVAAAPVCGPVEAAARAAVDELGELDGAEAALAEAAYVLARTLDEGAGMAAAAVAKQYHALLSALWEARDDEDEDDGAEDYGAT